MRESVYIFYLRVVVRCTADELLLPLISADTILSIDRWCFVHASMVMVVGESIDRAALMKKKKKKKKKKKIVQENKNLVV
jgi:hypothetical protein